MKKKLTLRNIISIILILIILFCGGKLLYKQFEYHEGTVTNNKLQTIMKAPPSENPTIDGLRLIMKNSNKMLEINPDYKFWLKIGGTEISYPVVQTDNNYYYLHHNFYNKKSIEGNLFINDKTNLETSRNIIVFGHNMRNGSMFGDLGDFKDTRFFDNHKYIYTVSNNTINQYEIFLDGVYPANYGYIIADFKNQQDFMDYINKMKVHDYFYRNVELNKDTKLLTLSTCSYEFDNARFVIIAKLVKTYN